MIILLVLYRPDQMHTDTQTTPFASKTFPLAFESRIGTSSALTDIKRYNADNNLRGGQGLQQISVS
jgi:hypothetical protein